MASGLMVNRMDLVASSILMAATSLALGRMARKMVKVPWSKHLEILFKVNGTKVSCKVKVKKLG